MKNKTIPEAKMVRKLCLFGAEYMINATDVNWVQIAQSKVANQNTNITTEVCNIGQKRTSGLTIYIPPVLNGNSQK